MKIVNRGFLIVSPKQPFFDWANEFEEEIFFSEEDDVEPTIYLVDEDFIETEQVIRDQFKKIFLNELNMITENTEDHPKINEQLFYEWFSVTAGTTIIDTQSADLKRFDLD
ncbi:hypothetical protein H9Y05_10710 [Crocinitomicaceae bacterium CZZ-1]|uniref:Uncharacterized protein n=1 Tax=Taishania pollutisoli TaxID=2766479 RepID=A0A8J6U2G2_9FLAO|nr:hypothetical protein [Taishania pollutisoli]MBC9812940.1 hypothetical protein [Taishania pollutisoli]